MLLFTYCAISNGFCVHQTALFRLYGSLNFLLRLFPKSSIIKITQSDFRDSYCFIFLSSFSYFSFLRALSPAYKQPGINHALFKGGLLLNYMNYKEFLETITQNLHRTLGDSYQIDVCPLSKNNGVILDGLRICRDGQIFVPTIYLNMYFDAYQNHSMSMEEILSDILGLYRCSTPPCCLSEESIRDFESLKSRVMYRMIHTESNQELLKELPSIRFLDLSVVFFLYLDENAAGQLTALIRKEHLRQWKVGVSDLWKLARVNTPAAYPPVVQSMTELLGTLSESTGIDLSERTAAEADPSKNEDPLPLYVITNNSGLYGAACMLYPNVLDDLASRLNQDLLILPSSIHEVLALPADTPVSLTELRAMISAINQVEVPPEDRLSDQVYFYQKDDGMLDLLPEEAFSEHSDENNFLS